MIESGELGRLLGYNAGWDLPPRERVRVTGLSERSDVQSERELTLIIKKVRPPLPRGMRDGGLHGNYEEEFRANFLDGAARRK